jgi:hypothetical protein
MITIAVLVCLLVITLIGSSLLRMVHSQRSVVRSEEYRLQADWLAESAVHRAAARLDEDPAYRGETWALTPADLGGAAPALVTIAVEPGGEGTASNQRRVTVQADYPSDPPLRVRSRKQATVELASRRQEAEP